MVVADSLGGNLAVHVVFVQKGLYSGQMLRLIALKGSPFRVQAIVADDVNHYPVQPELVGCFDESENIHPVILKPQVKAFCIQSNLYHDKSPPFIMRLSDAS